MEELEQKAEEIAKEEFPTDECRQIVAKTIYKKGYKQGYIEAMHHQGTFNDWVLENHSEVFDEYLQEEKKLAAIYRQVFKD